METELAGRTFTRAAFVVALVAGEATDIRGTRDTQAITIRIGGRIPLLILMTRTRHANWR